MDAAPGRRLQRRSSANIYCDGVARAGSAGTKSGSRARSLVLLTMLAPVVSPSSRTARFRDQLGLDDEVNSQIANGGDLGTCRPQVTSVGDLPTSSVSAVQLIPETIWVLRRRPL